MDVSVMDGLLLLQQEMLLPASPQIAPTFCCFFPAASGRNSANFSMAADQTASAPFWLVLWWLLLLPLGLISPHRLMYFS